MRPLGAGLVAAGLVVFGSTGPQPALAQDAGEGPRPLEVGEMAPDFALTGATRFGVLETPVRLSDFRGKTVVLSFFFKVRTKG